MSSLITAFLCILLLNSIGGLLLFEWAWATTKKLRERNEEIEKKYPAFRRNDKWNKRKYYLGALTLVIIRLTISISSFFSAYFVTLLLQIGNDGFKPLLSWRKKFLYTFFKLIAKNIIITSGFDIRRIPIKDFDYSYYLGPDYKEQLQSKRPSCLCVTGHTTWMDAVSLVFYYQSNFISKKSLERVPIIGTILVSMGNLFVDRSATA